MSKLNSFIASLLVLAVLAGGILMSSEPAQSEPAQGEVILACVDMTNGNTRIVESFDNCRQNEVPKSWTIEGEQGPQGMQGDPGVQGEQGAQGDPGEPGGLSGYERVVNSKICVGLMNDFFCTENAVCSEGKVPLGGSCACGIGTFASPGVFSEPELRAEDYVCFCLNATGGDANISVDVVVVCADNS